MIIIEISVFILYKKFWTLDQDLDQSAGLLKLNYTLSVLPSKTQLFSLNTVNLSSLTLGKGASKILVTKLMFGFVAFFFFKKLILSQVWLAGATERDESVFQLIKVQTFTNEWPSLISMLKLHRYWATLHIIFSYHFASFQHHTMKAVQWLVCYLLISLMSGDRGNTDLLPMSFQWWAGRKPI